MFVDPPLATIREEQSYELPQTVHYNRPVFVRAETISSAPDPGQPGGPPSSHSSPPGRGGGGGGGGGRGPPGEPEPSPPSPGGGDGGNWPPAPPPPNSGDPYDEYPGGGAPGGGPPGGDPPSGYFPGQFGQDPHSQRPIIVYVQQPEREQKSHRPKAREPDRFSGRDTSKVQTFILQCTLYFQNDLEAYVEDYKKINTAISFFEDLAMNWITPFLYIDPRPEILEDWGVFVRTLHDMFGDRDIMILAQSKLDALKMLDQHHAPRYIIEFAQWAPLTGYNEVALMRTFYNGLPERLKDKLSDIETPTTFADLRQTIQRLDARYWKRQYEKEPPRRATNKPAEKPKDQKPAASGNATASTSKTPETKAKAKPQLNSAGRLSDEERRRRMENKLCLYCAAPDHIRANCPTAPQMNKTTPDASKTTAANTTAPRVGRVVLTVPAEPSATIEAVEESSTEATETSESK